MKLQRFLPTISVLWNAWDKIIRRDNYSVILLVYSNKPLYNSELWSPIPPSFGYSLPYSSTCPWKRTCQLFTTCIGLMQLLICNIHRGDRLSTFHILLFTEMTWESPDIAWISLESNIEDFEHRHSNSIYIELSSSIDLF